MGPLCGKCKWEQPPRSYMKNEKCLRCQGDETALVISILFLLVAVPSVVALVLWRFTRARALSYRVYRRVFDIGRFKVVWVNYQIMATVSWNVQIAFPEPFATFERLLLVLDLSLLRIMPISCLVECECNYHRHRHCHRRVVCRRHGSCVSVTHESDCSSNDDVMC